MKKKFLKKFNALNMLKLWKKILIFYFFSQCPQKRIKAFFSKTNIKYNVIETALNYIHYIFPIL